MKQRSRFCPETNEYTIENHVQTSKISLSIGNICVTYRNMCVVLHSRCSHICVLNYLQLVVNLYMYVYSKVCVLTIPAVFGEETIGFMQKRETKSGSLVYYGALHSNRQVAAGIVTKRQISAWNLWNSK